MGPSKLGRDRPTAGGQGRSLICPKPVIRVAAIKPRRRRCWLGSCHRPRRSRNSLQAHPRKGPLQWPVHRRPETRSHCARVSPDSMRRPEFARMPLAARRKRLDHGRPCEIFLDARLLQVLPLDERRVIVFEDGRTLRTILADRPTDAPSDAPPRIAQLFGPHSVTHHSLTLARGRPILCDLVALLARHRGTRERSEPNHMIETIASRYSTSFWLERHGGRLATVAARINFTLCTIAASALVSSLANANDLYGLYPASAFRSTTGACDNCKVVRQALWYFRDEIVAVPLPGYPVSTFETGVDTFDDIRGSMISGSGLRRGRPTPRSTIRR